MSLIVIITVVIISYLLGSIPTAVWVGKKWHAIDVREHGSKNAGATNTFRVLGKKAGIIVLAIDVIKGATAVLTPFILDSMDLFRLNEHEIIQLQIFAAVFAVTGHIFPVFANFKGGKGVATSLGVVIGLHPLAAICCLVIFLVVFVASNYVSLGAISAAICFPLLIVFLFHENSVALIIFSSVLGAGVIAAHHKNIKRLLKGEENKMNLFHK